MKKRKIIKKQSLEKIGKTEEKKEGINQDKNIRKKQENQIKIFLIVMFFLLVFIFAVYMFYQASIKFSYAGLEFEKVKEGELILYRTPVFPVFFRTDPRELRDIKINGKIILMKDIGIGGDIDILSRCGDSKVAATSLAIFLGRTGLRPFSATTNESEAKEFNITHVECSLNANYSAVLFEKGDINEIEKQGNCYILKINNCEIMDVVERFMVATYAHSRNIEV